MARRLGEDAEAALTLSALTPSPDASGVARVDVPCWTSGAGCDAASHPVTIWEAVEPAGDIDPPWQIDTGHDLQAERVALALGGTSSCLNLADAGIGAAYEFVQLVARRKLVGLRRVTTQRWSPAKPLDGCCATSYDSAQGASAHVRSARHVAASFQADPRLVVGLGQAILRRHGMGLDPRVPQRWIDEAGRYVTPREGLGELWAAGVHPELIARLHDAVRPGRRPLTVSFYLGVVTRRPDLLWIARTAAGSNEGNLSEWLAWTETRRDVADRSARSSWLATGLSRRLILELSEMGYGPNDLQTIAEGLRWSAMAAASLLQDWTTAVGRLDVERLLNLFVAGVSPYQRINLSAVTRLRKAAERLEIELPQAELGFVLAAAGCVPTALAWLDAGVRNPQVIVEGTRRGDAIPTTHLLETA